MTLVDSATARGVATLTLDSPHNRNALSSALMDEFVSAIGAAAADEAVRVIVVTHTGPVFCSGADLKETAASYASGSVPAGRMGDVLAAIDECPKPVVARVGGPARAGGIGLIAACDLAACADDATFAFTEVRIGVIPAVISSTVLRRVAPRAAQELYLTGDLFDGRRAAAIGLVTASVPAADLDATVTAWTDSLVRGAPTALKGTKELLRRVPGATVRDDAADLSAVSTGYFLSPEGREGVLAFRERRDAWWVPTD